MDLVFKKIILLFFTVFLIGIISAALLNPFISSIDSPTGTCTCNSMVVRTSGTTDRYGGAPINLGPDIQTDDPYPYFALFDFEVVANIGGDDPNACIVWQGVQDTWHKLGNSYQVFGPPYGSGDNYGNDTPHSSWVNRSGGMITYADKPGFITLREPDYVPDGVWYKLRFFSKITGTDGKSCEKKFDLIFTADNNGTIITVPTLLLLGDSSSDCQRTKGTGLVEGECK